MDTSEANLTDQEQRQLSGAILTLRIIAGALIMGVATFAAITVFLVDDEADGGMPILFWLAIGIAVLSIVASQIAMAVMSRAAASKDFSVEKGIAAYTTRLIVGLAILEGAAFFTLIIFLVTGQWLLLAATAVLVAIMFTKFPSRRGLVRWIEERRQLAELSGHE